MNSTIGQEMKVKLHEERWEISLRLDDRIRNKDQINA